MAVKVEAKGRNVQTSPVLNAQINSAELDRSSVYRNAAGGGMGVLNWGGYERVGTHLQHVRHRLKS